MKKDLESAKIGDFIKINKRSKDFQVIANSKNFLLCKESCDRKINYELIVKNEEPEVYTNSIFNFNQAARLHFDLVLEQVQDWYDAFLENRLDEYSKLETKKYIDLELDFTFPEHIPDNITHQLILSEDPRGKNSEKLTKFEIYTAGVK